jgi:hypothetical protein
MLSWHDLMSNTRENVRGNAKENPKNHEKQGGREFWWR